MKRILVITFCLIFSAPLLANKVKRMDIDPPSGFDNSPIIKVYSSKGEKWDRIDTTNTTTISVGLSAKCKYEGKGNKAYKGKFLVPGFEAVGDLEPSNFLIPHTKQAKGKFRYGSGKGQELDPLKVCAQELEKKLSQNPGKTKYNFLAKGFTVNYPAALSVSYGLTCKPTGLGFTDYKSDVTKVNAKIQCLASALAEQKIPKPAPKRAKLVEPLKTASFIAVPANHTGQCPAQIEFKGSITANYKTTVRYKYVSSDGKSSPDFKLQFDKAGKKATRKWFKTVSKPEPAMGRSMSGKPSKWDVQAWYKLVVIAPKEGEIVANYKVDCIDPAPARSKLKTM